MSFYQDLESQIASAMQADRHRLRNMLRAVRKAEEVGRPPNEQLDKLLKQIDESARKREARQALVPRLLYDETLPIVAQRNEIAAAIREHPVVVVCGETGSGKSTQLPKICLEIGRGVAGLIGHTQPRRIAARSIASRLAEELSTSVGQKVGFKIRFTDATGPQTLIKVMTDGVLLAESQHDRFFDQYDTLIIDEAHERSLNIDFLLGYLKRLLAKRDDLRVIITSATIDAERFAAHFAMPPAPIIEVSGRAYPVEVFYRPLVQEDGEDQIDPIRGVADAVEEICRLGGGDVLVFLPTERHILEASHKLRGRNLPGGRPDILPLYARLSTAEQNRVFQSHSGRRIVLATNVAESSLTVPGIRFVVDTGTARVSRYSARSKLQRLPIERISQASADQRKGRCGRIGPGICIRLFDEDDFLSRDKFTSPEIQRTNLAAVILQLLALDLGSIDEFPFLDPPRAESIRDGYKTLYELNAIDDQRKLLPLGRQLARLPVDPRIGRMVIEADREHCLADVLIIAAALEIQDPRERPADRQQDADNAHAQWADPDSDFLSWLKLWDFIHHLKQQTTRGQFRKACQQNFLSEVRLREWQDVHRQLLEMVEQVGLRVGKRRWAGSHRTPSPPAPLPRGERGANADTYAAIHRALLAGLLSSIANRGEANEYTAAGGGKFQLWPGSGAFASKPKWIVAAEMVETTRRYLRTVARIDPDWIEPLATHLVTRNHSDPHWDRRAGGAMAVEKVSLFGLTIVPRRRVRFTTIDPKVSRQLFIQHGLVAGEFDTKAEFFHHNQRLVGEIEQLAAKTRRRELIVEPQLVADFYEARLPRTVVDSPSLDRWRPEAEKQNRRLLFLTEADLLGNQSATVPAEEYPADLQIDRLKLPLIYHFEPGAEQDGVTVTVPRAGLAQLSEERLGWLVPGLVADKIEALIRSLPKATRRSIGAAPEVARRIAGQIAFASAPLLSLVATALTKESGERITAEMFDLDRLPLHLRMKIRVIDDGGKTVIEGRDLETIREQLGEESGPPLVQTSSPWHRDGIIKWDFGPLPDHVDLHVGGLTLTKYPAVVDAGHSVNLRLCDTAVEARRLTRLGILRLFVLAEHRELKAQVKWLPQIERIRLFAAPLCTSQPIDDQLIDLLASRSLEAAGELPRDPDSFEAQRLIGRRHIVPSIQEVTKLVLPLFTNYHEVRLELEQSRPANCQLVLSDIRSQLAGLLPERYLVQTPWNRLIHLPRYLLAIGRRLKRLNSGGLERDRKQISILEPRQLALQTKVDVKDWGEIDEPQLAEYRWMLEELRVSLFAQELGTSVPVSPSRLDKHWSRLSVPP
jgi:ATP-dependent helicase HrpA